MDAVAKGYQLSQQNEPQLRPSLGLPKDTVLVEKPFSSIHWTKFNVDAYLAKGKLGPDEDKYAKNKFNQEASDSIPFDREIPDSRDQK